MQPTCSMMSLTKLGTHWKIYFGCACFSNYIMDFSLCGQIFWYNWQTWLAPQKCFQVQYWGFANVNNQLARETAFIFDQPCTGRKPMCICPNSKHIFKTRVTKPHFRLASQFGAKKYWRYLPNRGVSVRLLVNTSTDTESQKCGGSRTDSHSSRRARDGTVHAPKSFMGSRAVSLFFMTNGKVYKHAKNKSKSPSTIDTL